LSSSSHSQEEERRRNEIAIVAFDLSPPLLRVRCDSLLSAEIIIVHSEKVDCKLAVLRADLPLIKENENIFSQNSKIFASKDLNYNKFYTAACYQ
jgi:hypothetical protein